MPRSARLAAVSLLLSHLAAASPLPSDSTSVSMQVVRSLVHASGAQQCRITGSRLLRDGTETLIDSDFTARRTPGARIAITLSCAS